MSNKNYLYKYSHIDPNHPEYAGRIFTNNEVYFSSPGQFNDPFDCRHAYTFKATTRELREYFTRSLKLNYPNMPRGNRRRWIKDRVTNANIQSKAFKDLLAESEEEFRATIGIFCLTKVPDNILMWSHYADSHRGFCLKFVDDANEWFIGRAQEVIYSDEFPIMNPVLDDDATRFNKSILTKAVNWSYEQEWRIVDPFDGPGIKKFPKDVLEGVIFGCNMPEKSKDLIKKWSVTSMPHLNFYQAEKLPTRYGLEVVIA